MGAFSLQKQKPFNQLKLPSKSFSGEVQPLPKGRKIDIYFKLFEPDKLLFEN